MILLTVQPVLFMFGDMTPMPGSHPSFFLADLVIPAVQVMRFTPAHIAVFHFMMNTAVLFIQAVVNLRTARMIFCKTAVLGHGYVRNSKKCYK
jgi:hypothetical protein